MVRLRRCPKGENGTVFLPLQVEPCPLVYIFVYKFARIDRIRAVIIQACSLIVIVRIVYAVRPAPVYRICRFQKEPFLVKRFGIGETASQPVPALILEILLVYFFSFGAQKAIVVVIKLGNGFRTVCPVHIVFAEIVVQAHRQCPSRLPEPLPEQEKAPRLPRIADTVGKTVSAVAFKYVRLIAGQGRYVRICGIVGSFLKISRPEIELRTEKYGSVFGKLVVELYTEPVPVAAGHAISVFII